MDVTKKHYTFMLTWLISISAWLLSAAAFAESKNLTVAVANNFYIPMQKLAQTYQEEHDTLIEISTGSSGQLTSQIEHGAPFDVFFSADQARPQYLLDKGKATAPITYAEGTLVLWSKNSVWGHPESDDHKPNLSGRIAIPEPAVAPYGQAAKEYLEAIGLYEEKKSDYIFGKGLNATYQFAATHNSQFAFLALSQILNPNSEIGGTYWVVPNHLHHQILQDAVIIKDTPNLAQAEDFIEFMSSPRAQSIMVDFGYRIPE
ncbi:molybdenum ABC transporter periplasmic molybdenum-binding protein ModA [Vibrio astriarenae]|nr:molybdenum ABC transporter periplasmic molybdenum-binding protein ModA [Vibrio sp. C7]